jgi:uncharacterized protein YbjT (DUF2867 family)
MKIVVIGGSGLIGSKVVANLRQKGHQVIAASPATGINTITGEGLAEAMKDTDVVIDLANSPSFEDKAVLEFFQTSGRNLLGAEISAGVKHHYAKHWLHAGEESPGRDHQTIWSALYHNQEYPVPGIHGRYCR